MFKKSLLVGVLSSALTAGVLALSSAPAVLAQTPPTLAKCPTDARLSVSSPVASAPTTVSVVIQPSQNIKAASDADPTSLHVHYFIDTAPTDAGKTVPGGDPKIIHSGSLKQDLGNLAPGAHTVWVVLGQLDHTACTTRGVVTFNYQPAAPAVTAATVAAVVPPVIAAALPAAIPAVTPPNTGDAGLASTGLLGIDVNFAW